MHESGLLIAASITAGVLNALAGGGSFISLPALLYLICLYGGYFNGGAGIVIVALLCLLGNAPLLSLVATKSLFSVVMGGVSVSKRARCFALMSELVCVGSPLFNRYSHI